MQAGLVRHFMTTLYLIVALTVFNHLAYKGSKVLMALYAMELGASPMAVGVLFTLYSPDWRSEIRRRPRALLRPLQRRRERDQHARAR